MKDFSTLENKLKIKFSNQDLLVQAFVHRSYLNENPNFHLKNNERLEFLGDAVLELVISDYLFRNFPEKPEGEMTNWRAAMVNSKMLCQVAQEIGLNDYLLLSKGESKELGKARQYILANTIEALIGALYLDSGYKSCDDFIGRYVITQLPNIVKEGLYKDSKSRFQEQSQEKVGITPVYKVTKEWGPDHAKKFIIGVFLDDELVAEGGGSSKQEAEELAAQKALENKGWNQDIK